MPAIIGFFLLFLISISGIAQHPLANQEKDSVFISASRKYSNASLLRKFFYGSNYREIWEEPVTVPLFKFSQTGFSVKQLGGGQQTLSLRLEDRQGREWVLRTIDKDISKLRVPAFIPKGIIIPMTQDLISAGYPYSASIVYELAAAAGIIAAKPYLFYVAPDKALGEYEKLFQGKLCYLEQREPTPDNSDTKSTKTVLDNILEENDHLVIQKELLRARLLDMLVADWDRHADQWRWDKFEKGSIDLYYGIPRDRDQAFFKSNGFIVKLMQVFALRQLVGFRKNLKLKALNWKSWTFDRTFLNDLDEEEWRISIQDFQRLMTDSVISGAVKNVPPEVYGMTAPEFNEKLRSRRDQLLEEGIKYYRYISKVVVINGTAEDEKFEISSLDGKLFVKVIDAKKNRIIYNRAFDPAVTWKVIINGHGGKNSYVMEEVTNSSVRVEINGGLEEDLFSLKGRVKTLIRDDRTSANRFDVSGYHRVKYITHPASAK